MSKRPADNDHGDHESKNIKREYENKSARYTTRLLIPTKFGGQLIGKGGQIAKDIRARHNVDMFIPDARGPERLVRIKTDDRQDLANCVREISEVLQEDMNKALKLKDGESEVRVLLHKSLCGTIIGKGGADIKQLRENTNCAIRLNGECCPDSTDRTCQIAGKPDDIKDAFDQIMDLIENAELKGDDKWYNVENYDERISRDYGGYTVSQIEPGKSGPPTGRGTRRDDRRNDRDDRGGRRYDDRRSDYDRKPDYFRGSRDAPTWQPPVQPAYNYYQPPPGSYYQPPPGNAYPPPNHPPPAHHHQPPPPHGYAPPPQGGYYQPPPPPGDYYRSPPRDNRRDNKRESGGRDYYRR